jgi:hypothetical protein
MDAFGIRDIAKILVYGRVALSNSIPAVEGPRPSCVLARDLQSKSEFGLAGPTVNQESGENLRFRFLQKDDIGIRVAAQDAEIFAVRRPVE